MKEKLSKSVNVWITGKKQEIDPEEAIKKEIKFNLNLITIDNFDIIKDKILEIASQKYHFLLIIKTQTKLLLF